MSIGGQSAIKLKPGETRPELDYTRYSPRTWWTNLAAFHYGFEWREAGMSMLSTLRTTFFPAVLWGVAANSIFVIANSSAAQLASFVLLAQG